MIEMNQLNQDSFSMHTKLDLIDCNAINQNQVRIAQLRKLISPKYPPPQLKKVINHNHNQ